MNRAENTQLEKMSIVMYCNLRPSVNYEAHIEFEVGQPNLCVPDI